MLHSSRSSDARSASGLRRSREGALTLRVAGLFQAGDCRSARATVRNEDASVESHGRESGGVLRPSGCSPDESGSQTPSTRMNAGGQALPRRSATGGLSHLVGKLSHHEAARPFQMGLDERPGLRPILGQAQSDGVHLHSFPRGYGIETPYQGERHAQEHTELRPSAALALGAAGRRRRQLSECSTDGWRTPAPRPCPGRLDRVRPPPRHGRCPGRTARRRRAAGLPPAACPAGRRDRCHRSRVRARGRLRRVQRLDAGARAAARDRHRAHRAPAARRRGARLPRRQPAGHRDGRADLRRRRLPRLGLDPRATCPARDRSEDPRRRLG